MGSLWSKYVSLPKRKKQTLHAMCVGFVYFLLLYVLTAVFPISLCPIKNLFGISCFGCGLSRGFVAILKLDFKSAFEYHVLSLPLFIGILLYYLFGLIDILAGTNFIEKAEAALGKKHMLVLYGLILIAAAFLNARI